MRSFFLCKKLILKDIDSIKNILSYLDDEYLNQLEIIYSSQSKKRIMKTCEKYNIALF